MEKRSLLLLAMFFSANASSDGPDGADDRGVRSACAQQSMVRLDLSLQKRDSKDGRSSFSIPLSIPLMVEPTRYQGCMEINNQLPKVSKLVYFQDLNQCRRQSTSNPPELIASSHDQTIIASGLDALRFQECMRKLDGLPQVELLDPAPDGGR